MQVQNIKSKLYKYSTMELQIEGKLLQKLDVESGTSARGEWKKQNFIIETVEQYPRKICIAAWTNSIPILDTFQPGEMILVSVSIESREFNGKWYTDVRAWRIDRPSQMQQPQMQQPYGQPMQQPYGQPMQQPYGQPMQQPYAQPAQQPYAQPGNMPQQPNQFPDPQYQPGTDTNDLPF